jgi:hypothetical protein
MKVREHVYPRRGLAPTANRPGIATMGSIQAAHPSKTRIVIRFDAEYYRYMATIPYPVVFTSAPWYPERVNSTRLEGPCERHTLH